MGHGTSVLGSHSLDDCEQCSPSLYEAVFRGGLTGTLKVCWSEFEKIASARSQSVPGPHNDVIWGRAS
jgi:hypothetical protein